MSAWVLVATAALATAAVVGLQVRTSQGAAVVEREWRAQRPVAVADFGTTSRLEIIPLVNWRGGPGFATEAGVSYLIRTDQITILFDVGWNEHDQTPSPLQRNMAKLNIGAGDVDAVFLSHKHRDHVGGSKWAELDTFAISEPRVALPGTPVWTPAPMRYPGADIRVQNGPRQLAPALATTGPIARQLAMGRVEEQALVVHVRGRGLVVIVGCGHQTVPKLLHRMRASFAEPLYGVVGDLHYPMPNGRLTALGIDLQRRLASGGGPLKPVTVDTAKRELRMLRATGVRLLALGAHDTSDEMLTTAADIFGGSYRNVRVGEAIVITGE